MSVPETLPWNGANGYGRRSQRLKRPLFSSDTFSKKHKGKGKEYKSCTRPNILKKDILCQCLFPHTNRIYELYGTLCETVEEGRGLKRQKSIQDEFDRNVKVMKPNPRIELFYDSKIIVDLVKENTHEQGHHKNCGFKAEAGLESSTISVVVLSKGYVAGKDQIIRELEEENRFDAYIVYCVDLGTTDTKRDDRTYKVQENGKNIRAILTYLMEKQIKDKLETIKSRLQRKKERKLHEKYKAMSSRPETRAVSTRVAHFIGHGGNVGILNGIEEFKIRFPDEFIKTSEPYNHTLDRIVSLQNEIMPEPGLCQKKHKKETSMQMSASVRSALSKRKEVKVFGKFNDILEIWIDERMIKQHNAELEAELQKITGQVCNFRYVKYEPAIKKIKPGDKLHRDKNEESFGTIGTFAKSKNDVIAITMSHVLNKDKKSILKFDSKWHEMGTTVDFAPDKENVGFVHVNASLWELIELQIEKDGKLLESRLYDTDDNSTDTTQIVYKKGAKTAWTEGIITFDKQCQDESLIVENWRKDQKNFAEEGDSGSAIIKLDPGDPDNEKVEVISILCGKFLENGNVNAYLSYRLKEPLVTLSKNTEEEYTLK